MIGAALHQTGVVVGVGRHLGDLGEFGAVVGAAAVNDIAVGAAHLVPYQIDVVDVGGVFCQTGDLSDFNGSPGADA